MMRHVFRYRRGRQPLGEAGWSRHGITLFEVVLALAIFVGAFAAISQILRNGHYSAIRSRLMSEAALRCERRMNEVASGVLPLQPSHGVPFEDDADWVWSVDVYDSDVPDLLRIETVVEHLGTRSESSVGYRLSRLMRDPQMFYEAALLEEGF